MNHLSILAAALLAPAMLGAQVQQAPVSIVPMPETTLPLKHAPQPTTPAITPQDLMTRLYIFADDSMQGREAGTIGNVKGTDYIAAELKRIGLTPAGENGTYFQTLPFMNREIASDSRLVVAGSPLTLGTDWAVMGASTLTQSDIPVVYGGTLSQTTIPPSETVGKLVIYSIPEGPSGQAALSALGRAAPEAAAVGVVGLDQFIGYLMRPASFVDDPARVPPDAPVALLITREGASQIFGRPLESVGPGTTAGAATVDVRMSVEPVPFPARNVVAILPGSDPAVAGQYVAIGAHNDHVGFDNNPVDHDSLRIFNHIVRPMGADDGGNRASPEQQEEVNRQLAEWRAAHPGTQRADSIFNGADDDGSGSMTVLEIAESLANAPEKPRRSILFVWHVGEEKGLLGSAYFTDNPTVPRDSIVAQINMDMVGRGNAWDVTGRDKDGQILRGNPYYLQLVGSRRLSTELGNLVETVNTEAGLGFDFDYSIDTNGHPSNIYCRSDHWEYARWGIPVVFLTTGLHSDYHQVTDEPQYIDYDRMAHVSHLVEALATRVGNLDHRIVVDGQKPDPTGACRQ